MAHKNIKKSLTIQEICEGWDVSKRTIERKIKGGEIAPGSIETEGRTRRITLAAVIEAFGQPINQMEPVQEEPAEATHEAGQAGDVAPELVALLRDQLAKAEAREQDARLEAQRLAYELTQARERIDEITNGMVGTMHRQLLEYQESKQKPKNRLLAWFDKFKG